MLFIHLKPVLTEKESFILMEGILDDRLEQSLRMEGGKRKTLLLCDSEISQQEWKRIMNTHIH